AACAPPLGVAHGWCKTNSGFSTRLDTRLLANGLHELQVIATDREGWLTSVEVPIIVDNPACGDQTPPNTPLTYPNGGSVETGTVGVIASATDNVGVTSVQLLVDGSMVGSDSTMPYSWSWNSSAYPPGSHTLQSRAFDACNNSRTSASVTVTVAAPVTPPDI